MVGILDEIEKRLFDLIGIDEDIGKRVGKAEVNLHVVLLQLGGEDLEGVLEDEIQIAGFAQWVGGANGMEELLEQAVQTLNLVARGNEMFVKLVAIAGREVANSVSMQ